MFGKEKKKFGELGCGNRDIKSSLELNWDENCFIASCQGSALFF